MIVPSAPPDFGTHTREVRWIGVIVVVILLTALIIYNATRDVRAVNALPPQDQATFVRAECESVRVLCREGDATPACVDRAKLLLQLGGLDEQCRALCASIATPRR